MLKERSGQNGERLRKRRTGRPEGIMGTKITIKAEGREEGRRKIDFPKILPGAGSS